MRRMHIGSRASPMRLKHMKASPLDALNALIISLEPFNSQHPTFETTQKVQPEKKRGIVSTMIFKICYSIGPGTTFACVMKWSDSTRLTKTRQILLRRESLKRPLGKARSNFSKACLRQSIWDSKSPSRPFYSIWEVC